MTHEGFAVDLGFESADKGGAAYAGTTIGKRYARTDELGVPYDITVDRTTTDGDGTVTLRERDTTAQVPPSPICGA
jgi:hypothetical protein